MAEDGKFVVVKCSFLVPIWSERRAVRKDCVIHMRNDVGDRQIGPVPGMDAITICSRDVKAVPSKHLSHCPDGVGGEPQRLRWER